MPWSIAECKPIKFTHTIADLQDVPIAIFVDLVSVKSIKVLKMYFYNMIKTSNT